MPLDPVGSKLLARLSMGEDAAAELLIHALSASDPLPLLQGLTVARPDEGDGWFHYAEALLKAEQPDRAVEAATQAIRLLPDYAFAHYVRARGLAASEPARAKADLARALELDPGLRGELEPALAALATPAPPAAKVEQEPPAEGDSAKVRYEFSEGKSNKFWEIELDGSSFITSWGKIGTAGQTASKDFDDDAAAEDAYAKLIAEKVKKGYRLVGGTPPGAHASKVNPELESAALRQPDDPEPWLVYADWLQAEGDPRGKLIALQHAGNQAEVNKHLERHKAALLGPAGKSPERFEVAWRHGFFRSVRLNVDYETWEEGFRLDKLVRALLEHASARLLEDLILGPESFEGDANYQKCVDVLVAHAGPHTLKSLHLADFTSEDCEVSWSHLGNLSKLYAAFPQLERLTLHAGSMTLGKMSLPRLRELRVQTGGLSRASMASLAAASWPALERLELWFGSAGYGAECGLDDVTPILDAKALPKLRHLGLMNSEFTDEICRALVGSKILPQLETLNLSMGCMTGEGVEALLLARKAFAHLRLLDVSNNAIAGTEDRLQGLCAEVKMGDQSPDRVEEGHRYTAVGE